MGHFVHIITVIFALNYFCFFTSGCTMQASQSLQSGQSGCYGAFTSCIGKEQNIEQLYGVIWPANRLKDNADGTVTDTLTGLTWLKNANCFSLLTWESAVVATSSLVSGKCGLVDGSSAGQWRLPSKSELESIVNELQVNPATWLKSYFLYVQSNNYWTSTTYAGYSSMVWIVNMGDGFGNYIYTKTGSSNYLWPVREAGRGK